MAGHVAGGYLRAGLYQESERAMQFLHEAVYSFHMPLFIAISGFMFSLAYLAPRRLPKWGGIGRQVCNLLLLYVLWSAIYVGFSALFSRNVNTPLGLHSLLGIWRDPVGPYWYLYVLVALYAVYALLARLPLLPLLAASFVVCVVVSPFLPSACMLRATAFHSFFFMAGIAFHRVAKPLRRGVPSWRCWSVSPLSPLSGARGSGSTKTRSSSCCPPPARRSSSFGSSLPSGGRTAGLWPSSGATLWRYMWPTCPWGPGFAPCLSPSGSQTAL